MRCTWLIAWGAIFLPLQIRWRRAQIMLRWYAVLSLKSGPTPISCRVVLWLKVSVPMVKERPLYHFKTELQLVARFSTSA